MFSFTLFLVILAIIFVAKGVIIVQQAEVVIVCTSPYHFGNPVYKTMESFVEYIKDTDMILMTYTR